MLAVKRIFATEKTDGSELRYKISGQVKEIFSEIKVIFIYLFVYLLKGL